MKVLAGTPAGFGSAFHRINPIKKNSALEDLRKQTAEAREQYKRGEVYTLEEVMKDYGIE